MASGVYNRFKHNLFAGLVDLEGSGSHVIRVALLDSNHSFDADHNTWGEISGNEVSGDGYDANGAILANISITQDNTNDKGVFDGDDVTWASSTITARYAVIYDDTLVTKDLICCIDFGANKSSAGGDFVIQWNADGIITLS